MFSETALTLHEASLMFRISIVTSDPARVITDGSSFDRYQRSVSHICVISVGGAEIGDCEPQR